MAARLVLKAVAIPGLEARRSDEFRLLPRGVNAVFNE